MASGVACRASSLSVAGLTHPEPELVEPEGREAELHGIVVGQDEVAVLTETVRGRPVERQMCADDLNQA
jgi:hypothetical protein